MNKYFRGISFTNGCFEMVLLYWLKNYNPRICSVKLPEARETFESLSHKELNQFQASIQKH